MKTRISICLHENMNKDLKDESMRGMINSINEPVKLISYYDVIKNNYKRAREDNYDFDLDKFDRIMNDLKSLYFVDVRNENLDNFTTQLKLNKAVRFHEKERDLSIYSSHDILHSKQENFNHIKCINAWQIATKKGEGIKIAVIDTGINFEHDDIKGNLWNDNGKFGFNTLNDEQSVMDDNDDSHGTHVAGIISAVEGNTIGIKGIAPKSKIIAIKSFTGKGKIKNGYCSIYEAFCLAVMNGANIINCSWAYSECGQPSDTLNMAVDLANKNGAICVFAAGNGGNNAENFLPVNASKVIVVGAMNEKNADVYEDSNHGDIIDIYAPGEEILSLKDDIIYDYNSGTSMAAPHVSGALALFLSIPENQNKTLCDVKRKLKDIDNLVFSQALGKKIFTLNCERLLKP